MSTRSAIDQAERELTIAQALFTLGTPGYDQAKLDAIMAKIDSLMDKQADEWPPMPELKPLPPIPYTEDQIRCSECGKLLHGTERGKCREHR